MTLNRVFPNAQCTWNTALFQISLAEVLILKKYNVSWWFYCKVFARPLVPASCKITLRGLLQSVSPVASQLIQNLYQHPPISTYSWTFFHIQAPSCALSFISRTQTPLLFYTIIIPELTAGIFLLHVLGFKFFLKWHETLGKTYTSHMLRTNFLKSLLSVQYYLCQSNNAETNKRHANSLMSSKRSRQGWGQNCDLKTYQF